MLATNPTDVPVMVTVAGPFFAVELAVNVTTLDDAVGFVPNDAVTPFGSPETVNETFPENPFSGVTLTVPLPLPTPCWIVTVDGVVENLKVGFPTVTVRFSVVVFVNLPDVPVIVRVAVAGAAVAFRQGQRTIRGCWIRTERCRYSVWQPRHRQIHIPAETALGDDGDCAGAAVAMDDR